MEKHIYNETEVIVSCGDWVEVEYTCDGKWHKTRGWLEYGYDEKGSLYDFQKTEVARILGGDFVQGVILRDMDRGFQEVKIPVNDIWDMEKMDDTPYVRLHLEDYEALVDLSLMLKDKAMFDEYSAYVRLIRRIRKGVGNR